MSELFPISNDLNIDVTNNPLSIREKIETLEKEMFKAPQLQIGTAHHFAKGLYAREIFIPKGTLLTGKIHKHEHLNIISKGEITVLTENGLKKIKAPFTMVSLPGTKRVGFAHEDTVWTTIHASNETDLGKLEQELIAKDFNDIEQINDSELKKLKEAVCLG